jgi:hypothetical protein
MRCPNCGWTNTSSLAKCEKCEASLQGGAPPPRQERSGSKSASGGSGMVNATAMGRPAEMPAWDEQNPPVKPPRPPVSRPTEDLSKAEKPQKGMLTCPSCNYPNTSQANFCVACGGAFKESKNNNSDKFTIPATDQNASKNTDGVITDQRKRTSQAPSVSDASKSANFNATVNPWSQKKGQRFLLRPLPREGEQLHVVLPFEGETVDLNRSNLEPSNTTITSKMQAQIVFRDGVWYISNKSQQNTTFLRIDGEISLKKGDILLLGDRLFEFDL